MLGLGKIWQNWVDRWFPERQVYHRAGGTVRYISISPARQMLFAAVILAIVVIVTLTAGTMAVQAVGRVLNPVQSQSAGTTQDDGVELRRLTERIVELEAAVARERDTVSRLQQQRQDGSDDDGFSLPRLRWDPASWLESAYREYKAVMVSLEPDSAMSATEYLSSFLNLFAAAVYALFGGVGAVLGLVFSRLILGGRVRREA